MADDDPIEVPTDHGCRLEELTHRIAEQASTMRGDALADYARREAERVVGDREFERCCVPAYLALAPERFEREVQLPIACADAAEIDTRVLLWPRGSSDPHHPHKDGWAVVVPVRGRLVESRDQDGEREHREPPRKDADLLTPEDGVDHHMHNTGDEVGLSVHIFGK